MRHVDSVGGWFFFYRDRASTKQPRSQNPRSSTLIQTTVQRLKMTDRKMCLKVGLFGIDRQTNGSRDSIWYSTQRIVVILSLNSLSTRSNRRPNGGSGLWICRSGLALCQHFFFFFLKSITVSSASQLASQHPPQDLRDVK